MADPDQDHGFVFISDGRIDLDLSPFFDIEFGGDQTVAEYVDRISEVISTEIEITLGISYRYRRTHPESLLHPSYRALLSSSAEQISTDCQIAAPITEESLVPPVGDLRSNWNQGVFLPILVVLISSLLAHYYYSA